METLPFGKTSYLWILLLWAMPVLALQWVVAPHALWRNRRLIVASTLLCGTYLSLADHFAIARGIWQIREEGILGWRLQGHLPLEEAFFFFLTVALCVQGFVMISGYFFELVPHSDQSANKRKTKESNQK
jgi:lycopene cyclase domain-containing protein